MERTAYPQFKRLTSARVLHVFFTPSPEEVTWAEQRTGGRESCFALVLALKCFQKRARFPSPDEVPDVVIDHVRRCLELPDDVCPDHGLSRSAKAHRKLVRGLLVVGPVLADNDPEEQEKLIKFNTLLANLVVFHNALDISDIVRQLVAEGWQITADQLGQVAPYLRAHISRFGAYATEDLRRQPDPFDPLLKEIDFADVDLAA
ncbi:DUF4158 domain-containing protein [Nonomuraea cavernae]